MEFSWGKEYQSRPTFGFDFLILLFLTLVFLVERMVVLINYLHVMTILPSSILVNEIYVIPFRTDVFNWFERKFLPKKLNQKRGKSTSNEMNRLDRYLVQTYAPFVTRRSSYLIGLPVVMVSPVAKTSHRFDLKS